MGAIEIRRAEGKLSNLEKVLAEHPVQGCCGIGHTRWATHGRPSEVNAPSSQRGGALWWCTTASLKIIWSSKKGLLPKVILFKSETDTEIVAHLVEDYYKTNKDFVAAVRKALAEGSRSLCRCYPL